MKLERQDHFYAVNMVQQTLSCVINVKLLNIPNNHERLSAQCNRLFLGTCLLSMLILRPNHPIRFYGSIYWTITAIYFYTTKIRVCYGRMHVCTAMRFVVLWSIELKVGLGVGDGPTRFVGIFSKRSHLGSKVIQGSICLRNALWLPNLVRRTPDQSVVHCWGQKSGRGHLWSTMGQIAQKCLMATKFGWKNPWPKRNALLGSKVMLGSAGVK